MDRRQKEALDRWLTTDPRDTKDVCPECGECDLVTTDCEHEAWQCHTVVLLDGAGDPDVRVCRKEFEDIYHDDKCEHGLSAWLCEGPQHYPMD